MRVEVTFILNFNSPPIYRKILWKKINHITRGTRWSVNSFLGTEECVIGEHLNEQGKWQQYNKNYWRHDSCVPYINIKQNNVNAFHDEFSSQEEFDDVMMGRKRKPHLES